MENEKSELFILLLEEKKKRQLFEAAVLSALGKHYIYIPKETRLRDCATAGNLYKILSEELNLTNDTPFKQDIRKILVEKGIARIVLSHGQLWLRGLQMKNPASDKEIADRAFANDQKLSRIRKQRYRTKCKEQQKAQKNHAASND